MVVVITFLLRSWLLLSEAYSVHSNHCHDLGSRSALRENGADPCVHRRCGQEVDKAAHALMAEAADDDDSSMRSVLATTDLNVLKRDYSAPTLEVKLGKMIEVFGCAGKAMQSIVFRRRNAAEWPSSRDDVCRHRGREDIT